MIKPVEAEHSQGHYCSLLCKPDWGYQAGDMQAYRRIMCKLCIAIDKLTSTFYKKLTNYQNMLYFIYNLA